MILSLAGASSLAAWMLVLASKVHRAAGRIEALELFDVASLLRDIVPARQPAANLKVCSQGQKMVSSLLTKKVSTPNVQAGYIIVPGIPPVSSDDRPLPDHTAPLSKNDQSAYPPGAKGLWDFQEELKKDMRREFLDLDYSYGAGKIYFYEIAPSGLFSFEIVNEGSKAILLPTIECFNCGGNMSVFLERRIIEPGVRCYGIGLVKDIRHLKELRLILRSSNMGAKKMTLEVPQWPEL